MRLRLLQRGTRAFKLRFERLDSQLRADHGGFGASRIGFLSLQVGARLLLALNRAGTFFDKVPRPALLLLREPQLRLRLIELRFRLIDLFVLAANLRLDVADVGLRNGNLRLRLIDRDLVVAVVDPRQQIARIDMLIIGDRHIGDIAANLRRDRKTPGRDEGVVCRLIVTDVEPVSQAADQGDQQRTHSGRRNDPMLMQPTAP